MKPKLTMQDIKQNLEKGAVVIDGLDDCIVGISQHNTLVYSYTQFLKHFTFCNISMTEAIEYVELYVLPLQHMGEGFITLYETEYMYC